MSKSYVETYSVSLRERLDIALKKLDDFQARNDAKVKETLVRRGRRSLRARFAAWRGKPLTDNQAKKVALKSELWWFGLPDDYGSSGDRKLFIKLLNACEAGNPIHLHVDELAIINWWTTLVEEE